MSFATTVVQSSSNAHSIGNQLHIVHIVYDCYRLSHNCRFTKGSKGSANARYSVRQESGNDCNQNEHLREATSEGKEQTPKLPDRVYLEDIDFVSKEFDLFFKRKPDLPARMDDDSGDNSKSENGGTEMNVTCSKEQPATMEKCMAETSHYMSLKKAQEDGQSSANVYQSLMPRKKPIASMDVNDNKERHYQPLTLARQESKHDDSSHYQSLNATVTSTL